MTHQTLYDVLYVGNYTKDTVITPAGSRVVDGGAVNYAAHAAARLGFRAAVVIRLAMEDAMVIERLAQAGVDCFPLFTPRSTCLTLEYPTGDPDVRNLSVESIAGSITAEEVAPLQARAAVIGSSLRGEVGLDVVHALRSKGLTLAADMQGFLRVLRGGRLAAEPWDEMPETLACLDILKSDAVEAEQLTGEKDLHRAARAFAALGPQEILITHKDGLLLYASEEFHETAFYPGNLSGRSGRGDTCLGAYTALRLKHPPAAAATWAAAVTSLKMESPGPFDRPVAEVENLIHEKYIE